MKKVNLAKAVRHNKKCLGYAFRIWGNRYEYQNDNDLGLDCEGIDCLQTYNKKVYVGNGYYFYVLRGVYGSKEMAQSPYYPTLNMVALLLKECHSFLFTFSKREQARLKKYWGGY